MATWLWALCSLFNPFLASFSIELRVSGVFVRFAGCPWPSFGSYWQLLANFQDVNGVDAPNPGALWLCRNCCFFGSWKKGLLIGEDSENRPIGVCAGGEDGGVVVGVDALVTLLVALLMLSLDFDRQNPL